MWIANGKMLCKYRDYYSKRGVHRVHNAFFSFSKFCTLILAFEEI